MFFHNNPSLFLTVLPERKILSRFSAALATLIAPAASDSPAAPDAPAAELRDALMDLEGVAEEAKEEGYPVPSQIAMEHADLLLRKMHRHLPIRYEVYSGIKGEVAIEAPDGKGHSVLVLCDSDGGAMCFAKLKSGSRRAVYENINTVLDSFLYSALTEIKDGR